MTNTETSSSPTQSDQTLTKRVSSRATSSYIECSLLDKLLNYRARGLLFTVCLFLWYVLPFVFTFFHQNVEIKAEWGGARLQYRCSQQLLILVVLLANTRLIFPLPSVTNSFSDWHFLRLCSCTVYLIKLYNEYNIRYVDLNLVYLFMLWICVVLFVAKIQVSFYICCWSQIYMCSGPMWKRGFNNLVALLLTGSLCLWRKVRQICFEFTTLWTFRVEGTVSVIVKKISLSVCACMFGCVLNTDCYFVQLITNRLLYPFHNCNMTCIYEVFIISHKPFHLRLHTVTHFIITHKCQ